jgi:hypothetical protein
MIEFIFIVFVVALMFGCMVFLGWLAANGITKGQP